MFLFPELEKVKLTIILYQTEFEAIVRQFVQQPAYDQHIARSTHIQHPRDGDPQELYRYNPRCDSIFGMQMAVEIETCQVYNV